MSLLGQNAKYSSGADVFRSTPEGGPKSDITPWPFRADSAQKVLFGWRTKTFTTTDAVHEGPLRFIQNKPGTFVAALQGVAAAEEFRNQDLSLSKYNIDIVKFQQ